MNCYCLKGVLLFLLLFLHFQGRMETPIQTQEPVPPNS